MASETHNRSRAGEAAATSKRSAAHHPERAARRGEARRRGSPPRMAGGVKRRSARHEPVSPVPGAGGSRGIGVADESDWRLDPHAPGQVALQHATGPPAEIAEPTPERADRERISNVDAAWLQMDRARAIGDTLW